MNNNKNSLIYRYPEIAKEWHPTKNNILNLEDITAGSNKKVWWKCIEGHEWKVSVNSRTHNNSKCPYCTGRYAIEGVTDLITSNPELAEEWHPTKNGNLKPEHVKPMSNKIVWWKCKNGHEWESSISNRVNIKRCPYCSGKKVCKDNCLSTVNPRLAEEWHPTKNGNLKPEHVKPMSNKKVWWKCKKGHEWEASINNRSNMKNCPYCAGQKVCKDNCLSTVNPRLAEEWHPTKNEGLTPNDIIAGSTKKVWWKCKKGHEWQAKVYSRNSGINCPYCSGKKVCEDNCLSTINPRLAKEWHPTKNSNLKPEHVTSGSNKIVWWKCEKEHEWQANINSRHNRNTNCPYCTGQKVCKDNCLSAINPRLAKEWHPTKNGNLEPEHVTPGSTKEVWWKCEKGHEWKVRVCNRNNGTGCPTCQEGRSTSFREKSIFYYIKKIYTDTLSNHIIKINNIDFEVDIYIPNLKLGIEYDGYYWHKDKVDSDNIKNKLLSTEITLIRVREKKLPKLDSYPNIIEYNLQSDTKKELNKSIKFIIDFILSIDDKLNNNSILNIDINIDDDEIDILNLINHDEKSKSLKNYLPSIAKMWHPTKNGDLKPEHFTCGSGKKVWWMCPNGHEYYSEIISRVKGHGCPYCKNIKVYYEKSLAYLKPELIAEWNYEKNENINPEEVSCNSNKQVWWKCKRGHEWQAKVYDRNKGKDCPYCNGRYVIKGETDLKTLYPELGKQWHPTKNGNLKPEHVKPMSNKKVWWKCKRGHEWEAKICKRTIGHNCPICSNRKVMQGYNDLFTTNNKLSKEWHPTKNKDLKPTDITAISTKIVWWKCKEGHEWESKVCDRNKGKTCPQCKEHN